MVTSSLHPQKVTVWAGFTGTTMLPPFFFHDTVNGESYLNMLKVHVIPALTQRRMLRKTTFQQDGAPPHIANCVKDYLKMKFGNKIISRHFDRTWPPRSPDLSPADFWLWATLKHRVYVRNPGNMEELKQFISDEMAQISPEELQKSTESVCRRLETVKTSRGAHIEHLL